MANLDCESLLRLHGEDARSFLQGQTTADIVGAPIGSFRRGAFCDPKGRIIADFLAAVVDDETIILRSRDAVAGRVTEHLKKYLVFSKAELTMLDWYVSATEHDDSPTEFSATSIRIARGAGLVEHWTSNPVDAHEVDQNTYRRREIELGEARIEADTMGRYLPQDLNYDLNGAVSFEKGCYTGQEIVARLHYRGTPKRRLYRASAKTGIAIGPGTSLRDPAGERTVGSVVNSASSEDNWLLLVECTEQAPGTLLTVEDSDSTVEVTGACA